MKNFDYLFINEWMFDLLEDDKKSFDYAKLMIFSYIYSFSRDGKSTWYGKESDLAKMLRLSERSVYRKIKELVDDGYISKIEQKDSKGFIKKYSYKANLEKIQQVTSCQSSCDTESYGHVTPCHTLIYNKSESINQDKSARYIGYFNSSEKKLASGRLNHKSQIGVSVPPSPKLDISY